MHLSLLGRRAVPVALHMLRPLPAIGPWACSKPPLSFGAALLDRRILPSILAALSPGHCVRRTFALSVRSQVSPPDMRLAGLRHRSTASRKAKATSSATATADFPTTTYPRLGVTHNELKLRCTEFDQQGSVTTIAGEFSKSELCAQHGLQPRDLRKIDSLYVNQLPAILVRRHAILINIAHIRALIKADTVVLFDSIGSTDSYSQSIFIYDLQEKLRLGSTKNSSLPFEFRALESVLVSVVSTLQDEVQVVSSLVTNLLAHLEEKIDRDRLKELLQYSKRMSKFEQKVLNIRDAIVEVLEQDEDLAAMYLTAKKGEQPRNIHDHEEVELLLETYLKQVEEIANVISALSTNMRSTEDIVNIMLDSQRNDLMLLDLQVNIGMLGLTAGALIAGLFGMNLINHHESHPYAFIAVATTISLIMTIILTVSVRRMHQLLRKI
ncbi:magnesium ion transporter [Dimargaris verticillata]|uniref:Magnesium transporter n=1 Tax=Dimargaris verticillata TaxID=2761393 RepID=A0A9W8B1E8_9FUNG|nr:magnesium ion transporter [Dimargaris verticillata]